MLCIENLTLPYLRGLVSGDNKCSSIKPDREQERANSNMPFCSFSGFSSQNPHKQQHKHACFRLIR